MIFCAASAFGSTHYISKSLGSDSNAGTAKAAPWAHLPGMPTCSSNCNSYNPVPGDQFILYGGDTWTKNDLGVSWTSAGSAGNPIYIGVDQTWFNAAVCGASFCRPIFNCQVSPCTNSAIPEVMLQVAGSFVTIDNIEFTGWQQSGGPSALTQTLKDHTTIENCYFHGWSRAAGENDNGSTAAFSTNISNGEASVIGSTFHDNVVDGSDTTQDMMNGVIHAEIVYNNVIRFVVSGLLGEFTDVHSNLVEFDVTSYSGDHCNMAFLFGPFTGTQTWAYNNVVRHATCSGGSSLWLATSTGSSCSSCVTFAYNNVLYDIAGNFGAISTGYHPSTGNTGTYNLYNNTIQIGSGAGGACMGNGESSPRSVTNFENTHCIGSTTFQFCDGTGTTCNNVAGNLLQTDAQAAANVTPHFDLYTASEVFAYSPVAATNSTVGAGTNLSSMCSGNLAALCNDATYPEYDSVHHTVVLRTVNARPGGVAAWDIGAYQFMASTPPNPAAPLLATPH
jgi:hypothetical protein